MALAQIEQQQRANELLQRELAELARGQGMQLQRYRDGGLADAIAFRFADGLSWPMGGEAQAIRALLLMLSERYGAAR